MDELNTERALALIPEVREVNLLPAPIKHLKDVAKLMSESGPLVGPAFQGSAERCFAIAYQAAWWSRHGTDFDPFAVSQKAYVTVDTRGGKNVERINYEAQLIVALVNANAPLQEPLRVAYEGIGPTRQCTVSGLLKGSKEWKPYTSPTVGQIKVKNSPLWFSDPDQQLFYYSARMWARRWSPETIMGVYGADEMPEYVAQSARAAESLYQDESEDAEFEDASGPASAEPSPEAGRQAEASLAGTGAGMPAERGAIQEGGGGRVAPDPNADLPEGLRDTSEPDGSAEDREWLAKKQSDIMANNTLGRPEGADVWSELLFSSRRYRRVVAYQQALANVVRTNIEDHLARLRAAKEAGADPETGQLFDK